MNRYEPLGRLAGRQCGLVSRAQALAAGLTPDGIKWRIGQGQWTRVLPEVYAMNGTPDAWPRPLMAAQLWAGPGAVISHRAAAGLFKLDGIPVGTVELLNTSSCCHAPKGIILHRTEHLGRSEYGKLGEFRVTGLPRTLMDLVTVVDPVRWEAAAERAIQMQPIVLDQLAGLVAASPGGRGVTTVRRFLSGRDPKAAPSESVLETMFLHLFAACRLPPPVRQLEVFDAAGYIVRLDFAFPQIKLAVLTDGYETHMGRHRFELDREQANRLQLEGWLVLFITWRRIKEDPEGVKAELSRAYLARAR
ncbi:MAG TPA: hypothetical protein VHA57_05830 [Actinomycetota bacterium]|nr:hypothetical protein [Actinomycetota bacterium]